MTEAIVFLAAPVALAVMLVAIHAYLGLHVLERDVIFVDIGLSQVAALGAAVSMLFVPEGEGRFALFCSLSLCLVVALALALLRKFEKKLSQEVLIGMTYALASGFLILVSDQVPHGTEHLKHAMVGNILFVTWHQVFETAVVYGVVGLIHYVYRSMFWAASRGEVHSFFWDFLFYLLFGVVITFSTHHAGVLVVFAILVAPAALASRFFETVRVRLAAAWIMGTAAVLASFALSYVFDWPAGAALVAFVTTAFFTVLSISICLEKS